MLAPEDLWKAWKSNFTSWLDGHYKLSWEMSSEEWTRGVIEPYLLHVAREQMNLWIRFAQEGKTGAVIYDSDAEEALCHVEHLNDRDDVRDSLPALFNSGPGLKCVITYGDPKGGEPDVNRRENAELVEAWNESAIRPVILRLLSRKPEQSWLFIIGLEYDFRLESDWTAYLYSSDSGKATISQLS